ncbi:hypothetical protein KR222_003022 [Zaprionus bogoriensis]|nr:hypothetical protein KR222_003022 [Zaprionus bogoriensis]
MSRLLMATPSRLSRNLGINRLNCFVNLTRNLAAKTPIKKSKSPKSTLSDLPKPRRGYFPSGGTRAVFSDLPQPEGDFMKQWHAKNSKYNLILLSGLLAAFGSITLFMSTGALNATVPEYPYTEDEMEEFAQEEERRLEEKEEREERKQDLLDAKELTVRRRKAKEAMAREVELMQKDINGEIDDQEMTELLKLTQERDDFECWEKEEVKRIEEKDKEREKLKQEKAKIKQEKQAQREKERKERERA